MAGFLILLGIALIGVGLWDWKRSSDADNTGSLKRARAVTIAGFLLLFISIATSAQSNGPATATPVADVSSAPDSQPTLQATPDQHDAREGARSYWEGVIYWLAVSEECVGLARQSLGNGDAVSMQQYLTQAQQAADQAYSRAEGDVPDGDAWMNIQSNLMDASSKYKDAITAMKTALDTGSSEQAANALDATNQAGDTIIETTHQARVWYMAHGGKATDLDDLATAAKGVHSITNALMNTQ